MAESDDAALMLATLEAGGEAGVDFVPPLFDRFFAAFPHAREMFITLGPVMGRMANETVDALIGLAEKARWVETTVVGYVDLHRNYGEIPASEYAAFLDMLVDAIAEAAGAAWSDAADAAWRRQVDAMMAMIEAAGA